MSVYLPLFYNLSSSYGSLRCLHLSSVSSQLNFCLRFWFFFRNSVRLSSFRNECFGHKKDVFRRSCSWRSGGAPETPIWVDFLDTRKLQFQQLKIVLTLSAPAPKNGQTHSNNLSATTCCSDNTVLPLRKVAFIYESIRQIIFFYYIKSPSNRDL